MTDQEKIACSVFRVSDPDRISKRVLINAYSNLVVFNDNVCQYLFEENPRHVYFAKIPEEQRKRMITRGLSSRKGLARAWFKWKCR